MSPIDARIPTDNAGVEVEATLFGTEAEREEIRRLVEKQRALRDVADLIAQAGADVDVIAVIVREASRQVQGQPVTLTQFVGERELLVLASPDGPAEAGMRIVFEADTLPDRVLRTGSPFRVDDYTGQPDAEMAARFGNVAGVAVPIVVKGRTWGMFFISSSIGALPPETETLLAAFAKLVTASFDSIEARDQLRSVAEHDEAMRSIQQEAAGASVSDVAMRFVEYAAKLPGIEHAHPHTDGRRGGDRGESGRLDSELVRPSHADDRLPRHRSEGVRRCIHRGHDAAGPTQPHHRVSDRPQRGDRAGPSWRSPTANTSANSSTSRLHCGASRNWRHGACHGLGPWRTSSPRSAERRRIS